MRTFIFAFNQKHFPYLQLDFLQLHRSHPCPVPTDCSRTVSRILSVSSGMSVEASPRNFESSKPFLVNHVSMIPDRVLNWYLSSLIFKTTPTIFAASPPPRSNSGRNRITQSPTWNAPSFLLVWFTIFSACFFELTLAFSLATIAGCLSGPESLSKGKAAKISTICSL